MASAEIKMTLLNKVGLHARPAVQFVLTAARFTAAISVACRERQANAKSILQVLKLGATSRSEITIRAEGTDAEAALAALQALVAGRFGEAE